MLQERFMTAALLRSWCKIYDHCKDFPEGYKCCCDDAFYTKGELMNKLVKTKEEFREGELRSNYD